jgi:subtilisin family serine protease
VGRVSTDGEIVKRFAIFLALPALAALSAAAPAPTSALAEPSAAAPTPTPALAEPSAAVPARRPALAAPYAVPAPGSAQAAGQYIVTVRPGGVRRAITGVPREAITHVYTHVLNGFSARLDASRVERLRHDADVVSVAPVVAMHTQDTQVRAPWGLDRLDAVSGLDQRYTYHHTGRGVTAYVIDTGIDTSSADFGGRASIGYDATGGDGRDCNGHGTHVAGTIGGSTYGVAKAVTLRAVRVLDCQGAGTDADVVAGMDWLARHAQRPAVANMSLGGGKSAAVDAAAKRLTASGVFLAVAAGNFAGDACAYSPSGASGVFAVAASDRADASAGFTDHGRCVRLYAPGVEITSDWLAGALHTVSGTSMAAPHVTGVAALYKEAAGDAPPATVMSWLTAHAVRNAVRGVPSGTPNLLLNTGGL